MIETKPRKTKEAWADRTHYVYRFFHADGSALYVGCTCDLIRRTKRWNFTMALTGVRMDFCVCSDLESGLAREGYEIHRLRPERNVRFNPDQGGQQKPPALGPATFYDVPRAGGEFLAEKAIYDLPLETPEDDNG